MRLPAAICSSFRQAGVTLATANLFAYVIKIKFRQTRKKPASHLRGVGGRSRYCGSPLLGNNGTARAEPITAALSHCEVQANGGGAFELSYIVALQKNCVLIP